MMVPEAAIAMLACARIGAVHSVVFGGFSPEAIHGRIEDCASDWVICADEGLRGGKTVPLKANVDAALEKVGVQFTDDVTPYEEMKIGLLNGSRATLLLDPVPASHHLAGSRNWLHESTRHAM